MFNPSSFVDDRLRSEQSVPRAARNGAARRALVEPNRRHAKEPRIDALADRVALYVDSLVPQGHVRCLDIGGDGRLAEAVELRKSRTEWQCVDVHRLPCELGENAPWRACGALDGRTIPHDDGEFDVALLCDVLHDARMDAPRLLAEAARVARHVLVKDRFAHTPGRCFTRESFVRLVGEQQLRITALDCELDLRARSRGARTVRNGRGQFLAALTP